jgi:hypothetical protein
MALKRVEIKRKTPLRNKTSIRRGSKPLKARSAKKVREVRERTVLKQQKRNEDETCRRCRVAEGVLLHEPLRRSQGGDPTSDADTVLLCWQCHEEIHHDVALAHEDGWLIFRKDLGAAA